MPAAHLGAAAQHGQRGRLPLFDRTPGQRQLRSLVHVAAQAGQPQGREDNEGDPVRRELAPPRTDPVQMAPDEAGDQVQGRGVRSTASLASLRPVPVVARYRLIAWILRPGPVRPVGNARGVEEHDEDDKRQCCDSLGREPSSVAFARSGNVCTNLSGPT